MENTVKDHKQTVKSKDQLIFQTNNEVKKLKDTRKLQEKQTIEKDNFNKQK